MMATGSVRVSMGQFLLRSCPHLFNTDIEVEHLTGEGMIAVDGDLVLGHVGDDDELGLTIFTGRLESHAGLDIVYRSEVAAIFKVSSFVGGDWMTSECAEYRSVPQPANLEIESLPKSMTPGGLWLVVRRDAGQRLTPPMPRQAPRHVPTRQ